MEDGSQGRVGYPTDATDEEWAFVLPYLLPCREDSPQRKHDLRAVFNAVRYVASTGGQWRFLPNDMPPWHAVYQQMQRWLKWRYFEILVEDVGSLLRECGGRKASLRQSASIAAPCSPRRSRGPERATTGPSAASDRRCTFRSIGWPSAGVDCDPSRSGRPRTAPGSGRRDPTGNRQHGGAGLRGPGLYRTEGSGSGTPAWRPVGGGQAPHGQTRLVLLPRRWVMERSFARPHASEDWPETTSGSIPPLKASPCSPSLPSGSTTSPIPAHQVPNSHWMTSSLHLSQSNGPTRSTCN
jgi:hypothetical protein